MTVDCVAGYIDTWCSPNGKYISLALGCVFMWLCGFMVGLYTAPVPRLEAIGCEGVIGDYDHPTKLFANEEDHFPRCKVIQTNVWWR